MPDRLVVDTSPLRTARANPVKATGALLALSWSPQFCRDKRANPAFAQQCSGANGRFGFILHGLWPDAAGRNDPAYCTPATAVPADVMRRHFCMTPSTNLMQHEWAKHGTCGAANPAAYFEQAAQLYGRLRFPDMNVLSRQRLSVLQFRTVFAAANPGVPISAIAVDSDRGGWLKQVRLCLDTALRYRPCPAEDRGAALPLGLRIWRDEGGRR